MKFKNLISIGDFYDVYYQVRTSGFRLILNRFVLSKKGRIKSTWQHTEIPPTNWRFVPRILQRHNYLITGDPKIEFQDYVYKKYLAGKKNLRALSPGCGTGTLEIKFSKFDCFRLIEAFDLSERAIFEAVQKANQSGIGNIIRFFTGDVDNFEFGLSNYDMILLNGCLHHFEDLEHLLLRMKKALTPEGMIVVNEYVGPSRFQWTDKQLRLANKLLERIPMEYRKRWNSPMIKRKQYRPGVLRMRLYDPSEAVESGNILPFLQKYFNPLEIKSLGGNLVRLILNDISYNFLKDEEKTNKILEDLFNEEDKFLKENPSDFIFGVFKN